MLLVDSTGLTTKTLWNPDMAIPLFVGIIILTGWYRTTHLSDKARRDALDLRDVLLSVLPNASLVDVPESTRR